MAFPVNATLAAGLLFAQERLVSLREKLHTDTVGTHVPSHDVHTEIPTDTTAPGSKPIIGLNLISKFIRGNIQTSVLLGIKRGISSIRHTVDDTSTALNENSAPRHDSSDTTLINSAEQDLLDQQVLVETRDVGTQTHHHTATEGEDQPMLDKPEEDTEAYVAPPESNHDKVIDHLALTRYRPGQQSDLYLEHLTTEQGRQDTLREDHTTVFQEINEDNIRLRLQRDNLLTQCAALENDLSTSFLDKFNLQEQLSSAKRTIEKGKAYCARIEADWKRDIAKLQDMTRLFEAKTENARYVEMLRQQNVLEEANIWLSGEVQMRIEDHRFFACQRQAALDASSYHRSCEMSSEIQMLRQWLSTVQAQLADTGKVKTRLEGELQQERLKHQEVKDLFYQKPSEPKLTLSSPSYNAQQSAYAGSSTSHKPSKFTPKYPPGFQTRWPDAGASPQFSSERKSESNFGPDTFFEPRTASASSPQQFSTRSKSKFTFGDNAISPSASIATDITNGATPRTDFNFTFGGTVDQESSLSDDENTTEAVGADHSTSTPSVGSCEMPLVEAGNQQSLDECDHGEDQEIGEYVQEPSLALGSSCLASDLPTDVGDNGDLLEGLQPRMTAEHTVGYNSTKAAGLYVNRKTQNGARKPSASDFFQMDSVEAEVEMKSRGALAAEKNADEKVPVVAAADIAQETHIGGGAFHSATAEGSVQAGKDNKTLRAEQGSNPQSSPSTSKEVPKPPKNKGKSSRRAYLRKIAKARKRAEIGGANGGEI